MKTKASSEKAYKQAQKRCTETLKTYQKTRQDVEDSNAGFDRLEAADDKAQGEYNKALNDCVATLRSYYQIQLGTVKKIKGK
ncbi:hypothetical protein LCGC14_0329960 [marine sediment metagenome]|uniref:Uncharacterized protein n=1 Tax=marine sediment metagenome TaxID=412755 RepID=A0A0F9WNZ1_9ZZZZ